MPSPESAAIPYEAKDLRGERLLVLAPHPDDEVIGCGGLIALHRRERRSVHIAIVTDGAQGGNAAVREKEAARGIEIVGGADTTFLRFRDRQVSEDIDALSAKIRDLLTSIKPDLIAVPSPAEIHPDHIAVSQAFCQLVQNDATIFAEHAVARVAFYEVSATFRPNTLVDITTVSHMKYEAIAAHVSQHDTKNYSSYAEGLNAYRAMTLPHDVRFAEAYWVIALPELRTEPFSALRNRVTAPLPIETTREALPIAVVVRTKNRLPLLEEAVQSVRSSGPSAEVIIVNDGGEKPQIAGATVINHEKSRGRSEAMNAGVRAAKGQFIAFLDDDDLFYPEHLPTLAAAAASSPQHVAWYTDAVSAFLRRGASGEYETYSRQRIFGQDFDREQLLLDNYIPLPTLLVAKQTFLDAGGFDPEFDLFEDWDFLIRLASRGTFAHVPRLTCEVRHIEGAGSIVLDAPEGSERFRKAKLQVWKKHADLITQDVIANVMEKQKQRLLATQSDTIELRGERDHMRGDLARLEREKTHILGDIQTLSGRAAHLEGANAELRNALAAADADRYEKGLRLTDTKAAFDDVSAALQESQRTSAALYAEIARLQNLLDLIYSSRTWKLHSMVEKMKGRG